MQVTCTVKKKKKRRSFNHPKRSECRYNRMYTKTNPERRKKGRFIQQLTLVIIERALRIDVLYEISAGNNRGDETKLLLLVGKSYRYCYTYIHVFLRCIKQGGGERSPILGWYTRQIQLYGNFCMCSSWVVYCPMIFQWMNGFDFECYIVYFCGCRIFFVYGYQCS